MMLIMPELAVFLFSVYFLLVSLGDRKQVRLAVPLSLIILVLSLLTLGQKGLFFADAFRVDLFSQVFKVLLAMGFSFVLFMGAGKSEVSEGYGPEYMMFLGFSVLGLMLLVSSVELISVVLSLEISSYSLYVAVPLRKGRTKIQVEAAMKYLFFGAAATGVMLFGMGYLYALAKSTYLADIGRVMPTVIIQPLGIIAIVFTLAGFFFKLAIFPFHFWSPDIYEGASNTTTAFISSLPKIAAVALFIRILMLALPGSVQITSILMVLAALSMTFGNLVGLVQRDLKRLLAYSGIAHAGYVMLGFLSSTRDGYASAIYYIAVYLVMNLACFYVVIQVSRKGENPVLEDLSGLARRSPILALLLAVSAFSLAGMPPTGGFAGKLFLLTDAFKAGHLPIVIIASVNTVLSIFYYLNLVRISYARDAYPGTGGEILLGFRGKVLCILFILLILYTGLIPFGMLNLFKTML